MGLPFASSWVPIREFVEIGHASVLLLPGSGVPDRLFTNGWLNMSYVICPVASPVPPASSKRMMLKCPRPGSLGDKTSIPPPPSCSPLSGKSSSYTNTESFEGGNGSGSTRTVMTGGKVPEAVHVTAGATGTQAIGAPPIPWPQALGFEAFATPFVQSAVKFALANGLPASPGRTEM